jgi:hypothetical protein
MNQEQTQDVALVDEVDRFAREARSRLSTAGIETHFQRSPPNIPKTSAHITLDRLPHATADLSVWDTGEAELGAAWGQSGDQWAETLMEHLELQSVEAVRLALDRLVRLVQLDERPSQVK